MTVVVIDPGHGGDNLGGHTDEFIEQELTLKVANAMYDRLKQYDDVEVYLTRDNNTDPDLSRKDRATIAADHNADLFISLHFNMSENHDLYGAEVWTSAFGEYYEKGASFASIVMDSLHGELGFFDRGIKTRIGDDGTDYYGIIKYGTELNIPSVIIEHCHMDESRDYDFLHEHGEDSYTILGQADADCVAKYFRLSSSSLGLDYSSYEVPVLSAYEPVLPDDTAPETCEIELLDADTVSGTALVRMNASDSDSIIQYYRYSLDGGVSFTKLLPWNDDIEAGQSCEKGNVNASIELATGKESELIVRVYNRYDKYTDSNLIVLPAAEIKEQETETAQSADSVDEDDLKASEYDEIVAVPGELGAAKGSYNGLLISGAAIVICIAALLTVILVLVSSSRRRKKRKRRRRY